MVRSTPNYFHITVEGHSEISIAKAKGPGKGHYTEAEAVEAAQRIAKARGWV